MSISRIFFSVLVACATLPLIVVALSGAEPTICARVVIQIEQELTLEREGFEARLGIVNGLPSALTDFQVELKFFDAEGAPVPVLPDLGGRFFYRVQTGYTQPDSVAIGAEQKVAYLIVPTVGAAGSSANGSLYHIGATIKYKVAGREEIVEIAPDDIIVRPMPELQLQYFLPRDVFGDDPLTGDVEPIVPFPLGVRISNHSSYAVAKGVKIQSGQPEIVDNEQGLFVDYRIIASTVNGAPAQPTLLTDFGDVLPRRSTMANWLMTSTLSGQFVYFSAEVAHAPELGGAFTSLIPKDAISTHRLLGQVIADFPGRDTVLDYLATDVMTDDYSIVKLYESDNDEVSAAVNYYGPGSSEAALVPEGAGYRLTVNAVATLAYVRAMFPVGADKQVGAVRSDGKVLPVSNSWISRSRTPGGVIEYWFNLFDTSVAGQSYVITLTDSVQLNHAPVLTVSGSNFLVRSGGAISIVVSSQDPDGTIPALSTGALPDGAIFTDNHDGSGLLTWTPSSAQVGAYAILFRASDGFLSVTKTVRIGVLGAVDGFDAWRNSNWPGITDPSVIGAGADPDRDGIDNLLEYAMGSDPKIADDTLLPAIGVIKIGTISYLTLTYNSRTDDPSLKFEVIAASSSSAPLEDWVVQPLVIRSAPSNIGVNNIELTVRDSVQILPGERYLRLRVTREDVQ